MALRLTYPVSIISLMQIRNGSSEMLSNLPKVTQLKETGAVLSLPLVAELHSPPPVPQPVLGRGLQAVQIAGESSVLSEVEEGSASVFFHHSISPSSTGSYEGVGRTWSLWSVGLAIGPASFACKLGDFGKGGQPLWALISSSENCGGSSSALSIYRIAWSINQMSDGKRSLSGKGLPRAWCPPGSP